MNHDSIDYSPFEDATDLIGQPSALKARFDERGYLYLRGLIDPQTLLKLRQRIGQLCADAAWLKQDSDPTDLLTWTKPSVEGEDDYFKVYDPLQKLEAFHSLAHDSAIVSVMQALLGGRCFPHPLSVARLMFPFNTPWATPPHQDYPNNQGTKDLYACWIPLGDCDIDLGPLAICPGSHQRGLLPLKYALGAGHRQAFDAQQDFDWHSGAVHCGDVLIFHSLTVHRSLPNTSDSLRLSVDFRYQRDGDDLVERSLSPHFGRLSWPEIYADWQSDDLQYYWRQHDYRIVPWDNELHDVIDESMSEQIATKRRYEQYRDNVAQQFKSADGEASH